jgi:hypothetical protein
MLIVLCSRIWQGLPHPDTCKDESKFLAAMTSMNEVHFCGFNQLNEEDKSLIIKHAMDKSNWAKLNNRKQPSQKIEDVEATATTATMSTETTEPSLKTQDSGILIATTAAKTSKKSKGYAKVEKTEVEEERAIVKRENVDHNRQTGQLVPSRPSEFFIIPRPGVNGALADFLHGKTCVLTGIFPEVRSTLKTNDF